MKIHVKTPSRLHLGVIDLNGNLGRLYGSIGVAVNKPGIVLEARTAKKLNIAGKERNRVAGYVSRFAEHYGIEPGMRIEVKESIPGHTGLGSGTQIALSVGTAMALIHGIDASVDEIASVMRRGFVSGIGVAAFSRGGFVVDSGFNTGKRIPARPLFRRPFHRDWAFVVAVPKVGRGLYGEEENRAFREIIPGPEENAQAISRLVLMKLLPAYLEKDIISFGQAVTQIEEKTGEYYKSVPQQVYTARLAKYMISAGAYGAGQSSWGPAVYGLVERRDMQKIEALVKAFLKKEKIKGAVYAVDANNSGARIVIS